MKPKGWERLAQLCLPAGRHDGGAVRTLGVANAMQGFAKTAPVLKLIR